MSLVGTRPPTAGEYAQYSPHHKRRLSLKPGMAGFVLKNTLSDNGGVTRGICKMDEQNNLTEVVETKNIVKTANGEFIMYLKARYFSYLKNKQWKRCRSGQPGTFPDGPCVPAFRPFWRLALCEKLS